jgi:hypothetical protein
LALSKKRIANATDTREIYDLIAVGCGISGLAAAIFFQKFKGDARSSSAITRSSAAKRSSATNLTQFQFPRAERILRLR